MQIPFYLLALFTLSAQAQSVVITPEMHHLRNGETREWTKFPETSIMSLSLHFSAQQNVSEYTIEFRQYDVKQRWQVFINDNAIGTLIQDEQDITTYLAVPAGTLLNGDNELSIRTDEKVTDDILVGEISLHSQVKQDLLSASIELTVLGSNGAPLPARITVLNSRRSLQTFLIDSLCAAVAVRPGCLYTTNRERLKLPPGSYTLFAGRGFEYSVDSIQLTVVKSEQEQHTMKLTKQVETSGWICSDTHIHTNTYSGHGDASIQERAVTIAGEGIEFPVMTDHNQYVDLVPVIAASGGNLSALYTPVTGVEVTTQVGHFNVFDLSMNAPLIEHRAKNWDEISSDIQRAGHDKVVILNHARDIHNNFRPFDPARYIASAGMRVDGWKFPANAMEVINSGSQQNDVMVLFNDWMSLLNAGIMLTPIGSSDSHDVSRFIVGQGRTYIKGDDKQPGSLDKHALKSNLIAGKVNISCGLLTRILVNDQYGPGDMARGSRNMKVYIEVLGPAWVSADKVSLYVNGKVIREEKINHQKGKPLNWTRTWNLALPRHDVHLVAIARGQGDRMPFWPVNEPYQPTSPDWRPVLVGATGTVWVDQDRNGERNSARHYAQRIVDKTKSDIELIVNTLEDYDEAVAVQVAALLWKQGADLQSPAIQHALKRANADCRAGFEKVISDVSKIER